jgi:hypothetical protein
MREEAGFAEQNLCEKGGGGGGLLILLKEIYEHLCGIFYGTLVRVC